MIRRGLWVAVGAALGVSGYRRASRLLRGTGGGALAVPGAPRPVRPGRALLTVAASAGRGTVHGLAFARDVRDGMGEYLDRQAAGPGRTLDSQQGDSRPGRAPQSRRRSAAP